MGSRILVKVASQTAQRVECRFRQGDRTAPRTARAAVGHLAGVRDDVRRDLLIVVSELVANAVRHAPLTEGGSVWLVLQVRPGQVHVEVHDPGRGFDPTPDPLREGGLGLVTVDRVCRAWGIKGGEHTTVWCDLDAVRPDG
jgi:two-component sensor histidine kinase